MSRSRPLRLGIVSTMAGQPWGGSEELWAGAAAEARGRGWSVFASVPRWKVVPPPLLALQERGVALSRRSDQWSRREQLLRLAGTGRTLRDLARFGPDVVCISQGGTYDLARRQRLFDEIVEILAAARVPYVVLCHFNDDSVPTAEVRAREVALLGGAAAVAFVARDNLAGAERQLAWRVPRAVIVQNPVNLGDRSHAPWPGERTARFACVARLDVRYKGQDVLLEALAGAPWRDRDWSLSLFGAGPDHEYLSQLIRFYGLEERVHLRGHVPDVRAVWASHHLHLLPSRAEGTPIALIEALLCGRPVVATDVGGMRDWVEDGRTGFLCEAATPRSLAAALERAWAARGEWERMGEAAHRAASAQWGPTPAANLLRILEDVAEQGLRRAEHVVAPA